MAAISEQRESQEYREEEFNESGGSDPDCDSDDSDLDPSFTILDDIDEKFSKFSIKKSSKSHISKDLDMGIEKELAEMMDVSEIDEKSFEKVQKIIEAGQLEKLKVDQCKVYMRKNGLRLTGNKETLIQRIKEHLEIINGGGEKKYPVSSFVLNCKGDACTGDVVMFEQNVYEMFNIASRSASGPPCGTRVVAGRIVKDSYGTAKQQHTFTIEVLWSNGEKPFPPLHPLLIKGRNLYRLKTLRQRWEDEGERQRVLREKHSRGFLARSDRETRIQEKESRKMLRANRISNKVEPKMNRSQINSASTAKMEIQPQPLGSFGNSGSVAPQPHLSGVSIDLGKLAIRSHNSGLLNDLVKPAIQPQQSGLSVDSEKAASAPKHPATNHSGIHANYRGHNFYPNDNHDCLINNYHNANGMNGLSSRTHHRQPLTSLNHYPSMIPPQRQGQPQQQLCRYPPQQLYRYPQQQLCPYYAQGRCYYGDHCKFLHQQRS